MIDEGNDARFCREHAFAGNPLLRVSVILAPEQAHRLTALYALFDLVRRIGSMTEEEGAARVQLEWWRQECQVRDPADSSHPVLRELTRGGGHVPDRSAFGRLLEQAERRLEQPAMSDTKALRAFCEHEGDALLELERGLERVNATVGESGSRTRLAVRRGFWALLCDCFLAGEATGPWWIPLDLLAREGVRRSDVLRPGHECEARRIFSRILADIGSEAPFEIDISNNNQIDIHIFLIDHLISRKQQRLRRSGLENYARELSRVRVREFLSAWSLARRLNRRK